MGAVVACWVFSGNYIFTGLFGLMTMLGQLEYYRMVMNAGIFPARRITIVGAISCFATVRKCCRDKNSFFRSVSGTLTSDVCSLLGTLHSRVTSNMLTNVWFVGYDLVSNYETRGILDIRNCNYFHGDVLFRLRTFFLGSNTNIRNRTRANSSKPCVTRA